jgi:hypothetical protein
MFETNNFSEIFFKKIQTLNIFHDQSVPVTTAWRVLGLWMEERTPTWRVAATISNKQLRKADKGWSSSLAAG